MRIVFMGTPEFAVAALERIAAAHDVICVYTQPPRPAGRGQSERPGPAQEWATRRGILVRSPKSLKSPDAQSEFAALRADVAVVAAYGLILPQAILNAPKFGCINIHASLLPRWRGAAPIQRAIMAGDTQTGVTIMQMEAGLDTGPMLLTHAVPITDQTTAGELHDALAALGGKMILEALAGVAAATLKAKTQPADGVTYADKIDKAEAKIDFGHEAATVLRQVHGLSPFPGAWTEVAGERIKILSASLAQGKGQPGEVISVNMTIACAEGAIQPIDVQRSGRAAMAVGDFLRGFALPPGTKLA
ncbi:MAG: methionyl-tRNA formyltransferase [Rhodospirillaceae bacterium]|nr:methionyl-tRNA formyltransferase [Rhodospirillaceae bacterium]